MAPATVTIKPVTNLSSPNSSTTSFSMPISTTSASFIANPTVSVTDCLEIYHCVPLWQHLIPSSQLDATYMTIQGFLQRLLCHLLQSERAAREHIAGDTTSLSSGQHEAKRNDGSSMTPVSRSLLVTVPSFERSLGLHTSYRNFAIDVAAVAS